MASQKTYIYKVYDRSSNFKGVWSDVVSDFSLSEAINNAGGELQVTLARSSDNFGEGTDVDFGFIVKVYVEDGDAPNGTLVFTGAISNYTPTTGPQENVVVTILGFGSELDDFVIAASLTADQANTSGSTDQLFSDTAQVAQSFIPTVSGLDAVEVKLKTDATQNVTLSIYRDSGGAPASSPLAGASVTKEITSSSYSVERFTFESQLQLNIGDTYWIVLAGPAGGTVSQDFVSDSSDDTIHSYTTGEGYEACRAGRNLSVSGNETNFSIGQELFNPAFGYYDTDQIFLKFDTSSIPDSAVITAATLKIARQSGSSSNFTIEAYLKDWNAPLSTSSWVAGADLSALTRLATIAYNSLVSADTLYSMTNDGNNLKNNVSKSGYTNILLASANQKNDIAPSGTEETALRPGESAVTAARPTLSITYQGAALYAAYSSSNPYANGVMATLSGAVWTQVSGSDLYFNTLSSDNATTVAYSSQDPGAIMRDIMDKYIAAGGTLSYDTSTIELTGTTVSYTFNTNTTLEGIKKCLELAPAGWYFYINQSTNMVHFHNKSGSLQRSFNLGSDIISISPKKTIENMINQIFFTGGGSPVLFQKYQNATSIGLYGYKTLRYVDERVTVSATADTIANALLEQHNAPEIQLQFEIVDNNIASPGGYDLESIVLGEVAGIRNTGGANSSLWDVMYWDVDYWDYNIRDIATALLQIVRIERKPGSAKIFCSTVPPDVNKRIEDINRNLEAAQTVNNPSTPS